MKTILTVSLVTLALQILTGCGQQADEPVAADLAPAESAGADKSETLTGGGIAWYDGTVDEAFAHASETQKPIFLYWGAVWCPPCHEIKVTVFDTPEFVERSRLFVPVYLDGDTENAQAIGERFGVLGYPTMIVFSPGGEEITRIPGGIDIQAYATILDLTLENVKPVGNLLSDVLDNDVQLNAADCRLLAFYSWGQNTTILADHDGGAIFKRMYDACPASQTVERSRLYLNHLDRIIAAANAGDNAVPLSDEKKAEALTELNRILDNYEALKSSIYTTLFDGPGFARALTEPGTKARAGLIKKYHAAFARIVDDETVFKTERLYTLRGKIRFERIDDAEAGLSAGLVNEIRERIAWADSTTTDPYARQTVINGAGNVLEEAGMNEDARALLSAEIDKSRQPYYFMVSLADVEQADGNFDLALSWLKKAYDAATGPATRFQWGTYYVNGLIEMAPENTSEITAAVLSVVSEIEQDQAFYQRSTRYLNRMEQKLKSWNENDKYRESIDQIRSDVGAICAAIPADRSSRQTCENFLETA